jgi:hypothetical protein
MFCLVINEKMEIMSIDSGSKIKDYKIVDIVSFLFEEQIHWDIHYNYRKKIERLFYIDFWLRNTRKIPSNKEQRDYAQNVNRTKVSTLLGVFSVLLEGIFRVFQSQKST